MILPAIVTAQTNSYSLQNDPFLRQFSAHSLLKQRLQADQAGALPENVSQGWYAGAVEFIRSYEYYINPLGDETGSYGAVNRANNVGFRFLPDGYSIKRFDFANDMKELWQADVQILGVGRRNALLPALSAAKASAEEGLLQYSHPGFTVEYLNNEKGMRQNFIVEQRPEGQGDLRVELSLTGDLAASQSGPTSIYFHKKESALKVAFVYDDLRVWDANHRSLQAHFEVKNGERISIVVDDENAVYPITIDPLNHTPNWTDDGGGLIFTALLDGTASVHLLYGTSVSGAGNLNGDAFGDIVIGAPAFVQITSLLSGGTGGTYSAVSVGAAFVYLGSAGGPSATPSEVLQSTTFAGALYGFSVSKAGDVNNDGFGDLVIGAPGDQVNVSFPIIGALNVVVGSAYVYHGGTGATAFDGVITTQPVAARKLNMPGADMSAVLTTNPLFGFSVSEAGLVNNDAYGDIVIGAPAYIELLPTPTLGGRILVFHGSATGVPATPASKINGSLLGGLFGFSVSAAGDVNGDGRGDIIAGAPASLLAGLLSVGSAYVFHGVNTAGGITATSVAGASTNISPFGILAGTLFGFSVSNAGDVNGDGFGDVIIGEPLSLATLASLQLVAVGAAHIYYGSSGTGIVTATHTTLTSPRNSATLLGLIQGNLLYGYSVSTAGDVNCDGRADVIVGEPGGSGLSLLSGGILNLVSAQVLSGKAYVYYGRPTAGQVVPGPLNSPSFIVQEQNSLSIANLLGFSVSDAGDVNGDNRADILIGAPNGTLNLAGSLGNIVGNALGYLFNNSVGSAYSFFGCLTDIDLDFDNDGVPDAIDLDDDNDGIPDMQEYPGLTLLSDPGADDNGNGIPNYRDPTYTSCGGLNANGVCTNFDKDGDGVPNSFDLDSDNDGVPDIIENGGVDADGDGILDNFTDTDADGLSQSIDGNNTGLASSGQGLGVVDSDGDGIPNSLDSDSDGDGISDLRENGLPDADNNGLIDGFADSDGDGYANALDPRTGHSGPADPAASGIPALYTPADINNNGRYDGAPVIRNDDGDLRFNFIDADSDNDGITDNVEGQSTTGYQTPTATDANANGIADIYGVGGIVPVDTDSDGNPDYLDMDADNDGLSDIAEGHDINGNGMPDENLVLTNVDSDGDGIDDVFDTYNPGNGVNVTTQGIGSGMPVFGFGSMGPLQQTPAVAPDRDWRNGAYILPVSLVEFTGKKTNNGNLLEWITATEANSSHFEVERSEDGTSFTKIGEVKAAGESNQRRSYSFPDRNPRSGANYYRLRMVDLDNQFSYSKVLVLRNGNVANGIAVYPNPVADQLQLSWENMPAGNYVIDLLSAKGELVKQYRTRVTGSSQVMMISRESNWRSGVYMLRVSGGGEQKVLRIVVK